MSKPTLYIFMGYPGAGKTTVARIIANLTGAVHLWADNERHVMFEEPTHTKEESQELYAHLNLVADELLEQGNSVIFDTNFRYRRDRDFLRAIATRHNANVCLIWVTTPRDVAQKRATEQSGGRETRVWGNMSLSDFKRLSENLQKPDADEVVLQLDGTDLSPEIVKQKLGL